MDRFDSIFRDFPHMVHGGDYNPDQWLQMPDVLNEDIRLMKLAHINSVSIGIFSWKALEKEEGVYTFEWLDALMKRLEENGIGAILATPSGARPAWMDAAHPECLRTEANRVKNLHGARHNHCYTAPYYRKKVREMNSMLAERYKDSKALKMWHISNEYGGDCHCELCQDAFRAWLKNKYKTIENLNNEWWTRFWSHEFGSFEEIDSPAPHGEIGIHGLNLDWRRFVTYQTNDFMKNEIAPLKEITPNIPVTTNMMGTYTGLDYWAMKDDVDVISWDAYPSWHNDYESLADTAVDFAFKHNINRSMKHKPFMLMESTPSQVNWQRVNKLKRPGMHELASIQAVAHGSDTVQYFQWRKGRGASEKFHGAVVDHYGKEDTRVFKEVSTLGKHLTMLDDIVGTATNAEVAVIYDWNNRWAIDNLQGLNDRRRYEETCRKHFKAFWNMGIDVDIINELEDFSSYKLLVAPMLYMLRPGVSERIKAFVKNGGTLVLTYCSAYVNENDLCYLGGFPGDGLMEVAGVWAEEIDPLFDTDRNSIEFTTPIEGMQSSYVAKDLCEIIHLKGNAKALAYYGSDFYAGMPAVTMNKYGDGTCYYIATRDEGDFLRDFYKKLTADVKITRPAFADIPKDVSVTSREEGENKYFFIMNFSEEEKVVNLGDVKLYDIVNDRELSGTVTLGKYEYRIGKLIK